MFNPSFGGKNMAKQHVGGKMIERGLKRGKNAYFSLKQKNIHLCRHHEHGRIHLLTVYNS